MTTSTAAAKTSKAPAKPAAKTAEQAAAGRMAVINRPAPPAAPVTVITITNLTDAALNLLHLLATSPEPVSGSTLSPAVAYSLKSLAAKGIAELVPGDGKDKLYTLTERGRGLVALLWEIAADQAAAKQPTPARKPAARKATAAATA